MQMPMTVPILMMGFGLALIVRSGLIVAAGVEGRFRGDLLLTPLAGCALVLAGRALLG